MIKRTAAVAGRRRRIPRDFFAGVGPRIPPIELYWLRSKTLEVGITNYGGRILALRSVDRAGAFGDVALGFDSICDYSADTSFFGALIGRYANVIANGRVLIEGRDYRLEQNCGEHSLHGGSNGFDKRTWWAAQDGNTLTIQYLSPHGEAGFPGNLRVTVCYSVRGSSLSIAYLACADRSTLVNLTNHTYFDLSASTEKSVLSHRVAIRSVCFTPTREGSVPTGEIRSVEGTPLDFRTPKTFGERIGAADEQLRLAGGYDHNLVLRPESCRPALAAEVHEPETGRILKLWTTQPGLQLYTANHFDGSLVGKAGRRYYKYSGFCLETQHFPDSPNHPRFPSTLLRPGETFRSLTVYRFSSDAHEAPFGSICAN